MEQTELDLRQIFRLLRRRLWLLLLVPTVAALAAGVISYTVLQPAYSAQTTLWVIKDGSANLDLNQLMMNRSLTKTYAEVAQSRAVMVDVRKRLQITDVTVEDLQKKLTVTPVKDTEILSFAIEDKDARMAAKLADTVALAFQDQIRSFMKVENVVVVDRAAVPIKPIKPSPILNIAIALVLGAMAAVGLTFLLEYLDTTIKSPDDVAQYLGLPVLGVIPVMEGAEPEPDTRRAKARGTRAKRGVRA